jgi:uncharacterized protein with GYD domain
MATYIVLYRMTEEGAKNIDSLPQRVQEARTGAERAGVKVLGWYLTEGPYDVVTIVDAPDEQTIAAGALAIARNGNFQSLTMRAFDESEMQQIVQKVVSFSQQQ